MNKRLDHNGWKRRSNVLGIAQNIGKSILVSIPTLFPDGKARAYTLVGAELHGLWLQSDELTRRLLPNAQHVYASTAPVAFVPFAQISSVLMPTQAPIVAPQPLTAAEQPQTKVATRAAKAPRKAARPRVARKAR
jgi:hypothetical protein